MSGHPLSSRGRNAASPERPRTASGKMIPVKRGIVDIVAARERAVPNGPVDEIAGRMLQQEVGRPVAVELPGADELVSVPARVVDRVAGGDRPVIDDPVGEIAASVLQQEVG